jgi:hypothetical protein
LTTGPGVKPGEKPPTLPPEGRVHDNQGALFFAQYFIKIIDWSLATTDPSLIGPLSAESCVTCASYVSRLEKLRADGGYLTGGRLTITSEAVVPGASASQSDTVVEFEISQEIDVVHRPSAAPSTESRAHPNFSMRVYVSWTNETWTTTQMSTT